MAISAIKDKYTELLAFFKWWIPAYLPNSNLYFMGQSAPRPANPYIAINPIEEVEYIGNDERRVENGVEFLRGQRNITSNIYGYSDSTTRFDGNDDAWSMLQELRFSLNYPGVVNRMSEIICRVVDEGVVANTSATLNTTNEPAAVLSIVFSTVINQPIDSGEIVTVNSTGVLYTPNSEKQAGFSVTKP